ncbi:hypothetical protein N0V90_005640 [Kalmusia sp. IMI 367209]|nr:hypothetical protein N0V90_005640 [Kalmusia sp. IMI 367209]
MNKRYSSPYSRTESPRPTTYRKRSNSLPISDALGCSTPEAELILAEGRAAIRSRFADQQRGRRTRDGVETFNPRDHIRYLVQGSTVSEATDESSLSPPEPKPARHTRIPSDATDRSTSTIIAPIQPTVEDTSSTPTLATSPLGDYSAHLAKFIQSQLNSIPTYRPGDTTSPQSCPDLSFQSRSPPISPAKQVPIRRHVGAPSLIEIPSIRPPARSAFSAWSSTDDGTDDEPLSLHSNEPSQPDRKVDTYTPSVLRYYEQANDSTFLFSSTPPGDEDHPDTAKAFSFPKVTELPESTAESNSAPHVEDYPSSVLSRLSLVSASSAPSFSSISTASYFEYSMPIPHASGLKDRIIAAVTPPPGKVIPAISPFEGAALANVHDVFVQSQQRVLVDGMSFDMVRDFSMPDEGMRRVSTPC